VSLILAISGPAAVGKTTICERLISEFDGILHRLVTVTTREPRSCEIDGIDYIFLNEKEFDMKVSLNCYLEHETIHGKKYGVLKEPILKAHKNNEDILLNIDVNGAASLRKFCQENSSLTGRLKTIFIKPKSIDDLRRRIKGRASESESQINTRLSNAKAEIKREGEFDFVVVSNDRETDYLMIKKIYLSLRQR